MKVWKLVSGIISIVVFSIITFQSCAVEVVNFIDDNSADTSAGAGLAIAFFLLVAGLVSACAWKSEKRGIDIALVLIFGFAALIGFTNLGTFSDLEIWSWWAAICAGMAFISLFLPRKKNETNEIKTAETVHKILEDNANTQTSNVTALTKHHDEVKYEADTTRFKRIKYKGILSFEVTNDILKIKMTDGREFNSPICDMSVIYRTGIRANGGNAVRAYLLENTKTKQTLKIKTTDWNGFNYYTSDTRENMFAIIESAPTCKPSKREKIEQAISVIALILLIISIVIKFIS